MSSQTLKLGALVALAIGAFVGVAALGYAHLPTHTRVISGGLPQAGSVELNRLIDRGRYMARAADCIACHTAPGGSPFAGGLPMHTPIGTIYTTNITPDTTTGIGEYSLHDFDRAVRHGMAPDGSTLYPAMPYPSYAKLTDEDTRALYAYFMKDVAPVKAQNQASGITWPLSMRWPLALWRKAFSPSSPDVPVGEDLARYPDPVIARGAYLVQGAGHCGSCHTPRASTLQEVALDDSNPMYLSGGQIIDGWHTSNLRGNQADGLGRWSVEDLVATLKTGRNPHAAVVGQPMQDVVVHSMQHLTDADLTAIAKYLKTLSPAAADAAKFVPNDQTAKQLRIGQEPGRGAQIYVDSCAACHRTDGRGYGKAFPPIAGNATVLANDPTSLIRLVLAGGALPSTRERPSNLGMPGFAERLSDEEGAQLVTFIRAGWGNQASSVSRDDVRRVRNALAEEQATRAVVGNGK